MNIAIFGAGCFWCIEAFFSQLKGVEKVSSGYSGGNVPNPTYKSICTGNTGHAEVCKITFNPKLISFKELLNTFFSSHDPTTLNRQGNDVGTQYRSIILYLSESQKDISEKYIRKLKKENVYANAIVTEILKFNTFYKAEDYHQNYYLNNINAPYCKFVIKPKLEKYKK